jgi:predicted dehydrogenase
MRFSSRATAWRASSSPGWATVVSAMRDRAIAILCEKPCGLTADEAQQAARAAEDAGVVLQVVAVAIGRLSGGAVAAITLGRRFPPGDSCWLELFGSAGYVREPFMSNHEDFVSALAAQADAFAAAVAAAEPRGATGADAVAALRVAERIGSALLTGHER